MAAESGETKKPPRSAKATPKKPAKRASAAAGKPAKSASAAKGPANRASAAKKPARSAPAAAGKPAKSASAAAKKPAKRASTPAKKPAKRASAGAKKPATGASPTARKSAAAPSRAPAKRTVVEAAARSYFDALAARDARAAGRVWHGDGVNDLVPLGIFRGQAAIEALFEEMFAALPDGRFTVDRIIADDRAAAVQWRLAGTFSGASFQGLEPTGRRVDLRGTDCLEIENGKIVHNTGVFDGAAFARQVGLLPAEDSGADRAIRAGFNTVTKLRRTVARRTAR